MVYAPNCHAGGPALLSTEIRRSGLLAWSTVFVGMRRGKDWLKILTGYHRCRRTNWSWIDVEKKLLMIAPFGLESANLIQALMLPPWAPQDSGIVIQACDWLPKSSHCCRDLIMVTTVLIWNGFVFVKNLWYETKLSSTFIENVWTPPPLNWMVSKNGSPKKSTKEQHKFLYALVFKMFKD